MPNLPLITEQHLAANVHSGTNSPYDQELAEEIDDDLPNRRLLKLNLLSSWRGSHLPLRRVKLRRRGIVGHLILSDHRHQTPSQPQYNARADTSA
jgi:hypothetical protein